LIVYDFFDYDHKRLKTDNLFKIDADPKDVEILEENIVQGNYRHIDDIYKPHIVANYFLCVLKYMAEPLCTFRLYEEFKKLSLKNNIVTQMVELNEAAVPCVNEIFNQMDSLTRNSWKFILHFLLLLNS
jgi:hypothetical protein